MRANLRERRLPTRVWHRPGRILLDTSLRKKVELEGTCPSETRTERLYEESGLMRSLSAHMKDQHAAPQGGQDCPDRCVHG